jgi:hypothetical protein
MRNRKEVITDAIINHAQKINRNQFLLGENFGRRAEGRSKSKLLGIIFGALQRWKQKSQNLHFGL